jgi:hypothetical protein
VSKSEKHLLCVGHALHLPSGVAESEWLESGRRTNRTTPGNRDGGQFLIVFFNT